MKIQKHVLSSLEKCYAVNAFELGGKLKYLFASETAAPCYCFDAQTLERETVWTQDGGTMGMVPIGERSFLAIQNFFPPFLAKESRIVRVTQTEKGFEQEELLALPYLHRFGIVAGDGRQWMVLSVLCESKEHKDDWSKPGSVSIAQMDAQGNLLEKPRKILDGQVHNHGFYWKRSGRVAADCTEGRDGLYCCADDERSDGRGVVGGSGRRRTGRTDHAGSLSRYDAARLSSDTEGRMAVCMDLSDSNELCPCALVRRFVWQAVRRMLKPKGSGAAVPVLV